MAGLAGWASAELRARRQLGRANLPKRARAMVLTVIDHSLARGRHWCHAPDAATLAIAAGLPTGSAKREGARILRELVEAGALTERRYDGQLDLAVGRALESTAPGASGAQRDAAATLEHTAHLRAAGALSDGQRVLPMETRDGGQEFADALAEVELCADPDSHLPLEEIERPERRSNVGESSTEHREKPQPAEPDLADLDPSDILRRCMESLGSAEDSDPAPVSELTPACENSHRRVRTHTDPVSELTPACENSHRGGGEKTAPLTRRAGTRTREEVKKVNKVQEELLKPTDRQIPFRTSVPSSREKEQGSCRSDSPKSLKEYHDGRRDQPGHQTEPPGRRQAGPTLSRAGDGVGSKTPQLDDVRAKLQAKGDAPRERLLDRLITEARRAPGGLENLEQWAPKWLTRLRQMPEAIAEAIAEHKLKRDPAKSPPAWICSMAERFNREGAAV